MITNQENGLNDFLFCESTITWCLPDLVRSMDGRDDLNVLRDCDCDLGKNFSTGRTEEMLQSSETIPLVVLHESGHSCSRTVEIALVGGIPELKKGNCSSTSKICTFGEEGDQSTICTRSSSLSSFDFDSCLSSCWSNDDDAADDADDMFDVYFAEESKSSLDYSSSRCDDFIKVNEHFRSRLDSSDESYYTEGFIDVGDLPRVS